MHHYEPSACQHDEERARESEGERERERESEQCRVSSTKVKLQYSNLIRSIREFPVQGQPPCCAHRLIMSITHYIMLSYM